MGFERAESPSQVKGSALVGLGKTQKPEGERAQSLTKDPPERVSNRTRRLLR